MSSTDLTPWLLRVVVAALWIAPIVLGIRSARRKGLSPHWMWFGLHPIPGWIAYFIIAARAQCPRCGSYHNRRANESEAKPFGVAFRPPRVCRQCSNIWEPETAAFILLLGIPVGLGIIGFGLLVLVSAQVSSWFGALSAIWAAIFFFALGGALLVGSIVRLAKRTSQAASPTSRDPT